MKPDIIFTLALALWLVTGCLGANLSPIYTTGNFWHGSDKNGTRTKNYSTDVLFTRLFFCRAKRREKIFWYG